MDSFTLVFLLLGALAGGFVSGLAGFGTGLMALGIWLYVLPPSMAVPLVLICSIVGQTTTLFSLWRLIDFRLVWPFLIGGLLGVPLGTLLVAHADPQVFKLGVTRRWRRAAISGCIFFQAHPADQAPWQTRKVLATGDVIRRFP